MKLQPALTMAFLAAFSAAAWADDVGVIAERGGDRYRQVDIRHLVR